LTRRVDFLARGGQMRFLANILEEPNANGIGELTQANRHRGLRHVQCLRGARAVAEKDHGPEYHQLRQCSMSEVALYLAVGHEDLTFVATLKTPSRRRLNATTKA